MQGADYELRDRIETVEDASADENRLVTLAVPPEQSLGAVVEEIEEDHAEAEYLDDRASGPLTEALGRVRHTLLDYDSLPENGLVVYAGVVGGDLVDYEFDDLPDPVPEYTYDVSNTFDVSPLEAAVEGGEEYGLLVIERGGAALGRYRRGSLTVHETFDSNVMGKTKAGGQSADRFARRREEQKANFFADVADAAAREFLDPAVDDLLLGGTEVTVASFREGDYLDYRLQDRVVGTHSVEYASEKGLRELVEKAADAGELDVHREARDALDRFFAALHDEDEPVAYGPEEVDRALDYGAVDTLLVSAALDVADVRELEARTADEGGDCVVVPEEVDRGQQFREAFDGVGALLRFEIE
ncbi:Vms1/Ankzf1 family peptidyl-tRNA hydrolase [Halospeciosus flavus]|uniref:Vms1/Ankzf1 family peptidyl-tRNA hydrolase n=1 Tax=Halospeciosus flavus TaxID=3032283 RepID=A0ABD5Z6Y1_9EURY|nr:Vms1/Ankzf1 family peptidyl-tRNA hydrolase [Halospeciosus flavus]